MTRGACLLEHLVAAERNFAGRLPDGNPSRGEVVQSRLSGLKIKATMAIPAFADILDAARTQVGAAALEARLPRPKPPEQLADTPDDRYLSQMSLRIFRAGLKHS